MDKRFDGDCLNVSIAIDNKLAEMWRNLEPHHNVFELNEPGKVSDNISIPKTVICTISNWLQSKRIDTVSQEKINLFNAIPKIE